MVSYLRFGKNFKKKNPNISQDMKLDKWAPESRQWCWSGQIFHYVYPLYGARLGQSKWWWGGNIFLNIG